MRENKLKYSKCFKPKNPTKSLTSHKVRSNRLVYFVMLVGYMNSGTIVHICEGDNFIWRKVNKLRN